MPEQHQRKPLDILRTSPGLARIRHQHASHLLGLLEAGPRSTRLKATGYAAKDIVFFDDLADNVAAAQSCGWRAVQVVPPGDTAASGCRGLRRGTGCDPRSRGCSARAVDSPESALPSPLQTRRALDATRRAAAP